MDRRAFLKKTTLTTSIMGSCLMGLNTLSFADLSSSSNEYSRNDSKPNIILILMDQFRPDHLNDKYTPNLFKLANEGVRFTNAYTPSPLCQPARTSIITGMYPSQTKICGNQSDPIRDGLRDDTFMKHLQNGGYHTALIGKHHYIDRWGVGLDVVEQDMEEVKKYGFDQVTQCLDIWEHVWYNDDDYIYYLRKKGLEKRLKDNLATGVKEGVHPLRDDDTEDGFIGNSAVNFIDAYNKKQPFYLNVSFVGPHPPYIHPGKATFLPNTTAPPLGVANAEKTKNNRAHYANYCLHLDKYVAKIVQALKDNGLYDNTVIIFTADHGDCLGDFGIWDKRYFYEQSAGVPMLIAGKSIPKNIRGNNARVCKALVSTLDLYPTILELAGINITKRDRQGKSLLDVIRGEESAYRRAVFSQLGTAAMIRTSKWKLVFDPEQGGICYLFNLVNDAQELINLTGVAGYEEISYKLVRHLMSFYIDLHQFTHVKEQQRLQKVRTVFDE